MAMQQEQNVALYGTVPPCIGSWRSPIETFINPSYFAVNAEKSQVFHIGSLTPAYQF